MKVVIATPTLFDKTSPFNHLLKDMLLGFVSEGIEIERIAAVEK